MRLLHTSAWLYRKLLWAYPPDLRRDFGDEMAIIFAADLEERGMIATWRCAIAELATIALPGLKSNPLVLVPALSFIFAASSLSVELGCAVHFAGPMGAARLLEQFRLAVFLPSTLDAVVALVVTRFYASRVVTTLQLN
jgi:hypothetical protein